MSDNMNSPIDFVIIWVDGNDKEWRAEKAKYDGSVTGPSDSEVRYRDWDNLRYWFRGVEKFAPWVNKIHFVTWGHLPEWLDTSNPKLNIVNHRDYIPEKYLPTFSSHTIELNLHRIKGLADKFVYFNDDMFITAPTTPEDFFKDGKPRDTAFRRDFKKWFDPKNKFKNIVRTVLLMPWHWFPGFYYQHTPNSFLKATFEEVWEKEFEKLDKTCSHKFRKEGDVNQWVMKFWQLASGNFVVRRDSFALCYHVKEYNYEKLLNDIPSRKHEMICINDTAETYDFEQKKEGVKTAFEKLLPEKCSFEK